MLWADLPIVAFKRWVKDLGNVVMVLVVLTERDPVEAAKAVFIRCGCLLIPLSVLFIKYYPELGRAYHATTGEMMFTGVAAHKNTLGVLVMVCGLFLMWDFVESLPRRLKPLDWSGLATDVLLLGMAVWLLFTSQADLAGLRLCRDGDLFRPPDTGDKNRINRLEAYAIVGGGLFWLLNSVFSLQSVGGAEYFLGRDMTLRMQRTEDLARAAESGGQPDFGSRL